MKTQIVILAAGKGTRMGNGTMPKVLVSLQNKPIIFHLLEQVERLKPLLPPVVVVGYMHEQVRTMLGDAYRYALQEEQLGTGHAVLCAQPQVEAENILVLYGDMPFVSSASLQRIISRHVGQQAAMTMFTAEVPEYEGVYQSMNGFGRIVRSPDGTLARITEYRDATGAERGIREVNPGIYMFNASWLWGRLKTLDRKNAQGEFYLTDMAEIAMREGTPVHSLSIDPLEVLGINTLHELATAERLAGKNGA